jgi:hypothetical protein
MPGVKARFDPAQLGGSIALLPHLELQWGPPLRQAKVQQERVVGRVVADDHGAPPYAWERGRNPFTHQ